MQFFSQYFCNEQSHTHILLNEALLQLIGRWWPSSFSKPHPHSFKPHPHSWWITSGYYLSHILSPNHTHILGDKPQGDLSKDLFLCSGTWWSERSKFCCTMDDCNL